MASLSAADFESELSASAAGQSLLSLAGAPQCGIDFHYIEYVTVGAKGELTTATGALMVPNGSTAPCGGPRPTVLYAHGTTADKNYNIADIMDTDNFAYEESVYIAAMFAAHGYIVVAPNYAGYDTSPLPYHPYLNADQQSKDVIDALTAARAALGEIPASATLLCGGSEDPVVFFINAQAMQAFWEPFNLPAGLLTVLDLETGLGADDPYAAAVAGFAALKAQTAADAVAAGATDGGAAAVAEHYHGGMVAPFCLAAARGFFDNF